jgi:NAD(P)H-dependent FMN reductase
MPTRILVFAGSIRSGALSAKLAAAAAKEIALNDADVTTISLADYPLPMYNGDIEETKGVPENATKLAQMVAANQGIFVSTPEYNHSLPPLLTNAIAWVSRLQHTGTLPYRHKVYCLGGTSDGRYGGARDHRSAQGTRHRLAGCDDPAARRGAHGAACVQRIGRVDR